MHDRYVLYLLLGICKNYGHEKGNIKIFIDNIYNRAVCAWVSTWDGVA